MKKQITQIRDIKEIEKQLVQSHSGVLCIHLDNEKLMQLACNFVYLDKNIYTFLDNSDENFEHIKYGSSGSFTVSSSDKITDRKSEFTYRLTYITINGEIKDIDDNKLKDQVIELYRLKYSSDIKSAEYELSEILKPILLDTKEINAQIEEGN